MKPNYQLNTNDGHCLAVYTNGNPENPPLIFLHGGPGGSINEKIWSFFDLNKWFVIAFDQRGCGQSTPFASLENNTPSTGVEDIEMIRRFFDIDTWTVFGGSYGSTLALCYAIKYPTHVKQMILRGIFLGRPEDVHFLFQEGTSYFYPIEHEKFRTFMPKDKQDNLIQSYYDIFRSDDAQLKRKAAKSWSDWENSVMRLMPDFSHFDNVVDDNDVSLGLLECHFFANDMFWEDKNYILNNADTISDIPTHIVHGRYDVDCRPIGAYLLSKHLNNCALNIVEVSGHTPYEKAMFDTLVEIMKSLENDKKSNA